MDTEKELKLINLLPKYQTIEEYSNLVRAILYYLYDSHGAVEYGAIKFKKKRDFIIKVLFKYALLKKDVDGVDIIDFKYFPQELASKIIDSYHKDLGLIQQKQEDKEVEALIIEMDEIF